MNELLPGILITFFIYIVSGYIKKHINVLLLNKFIIATILGLLFMLVFKIPYEVYAPGGNFIKFFLAPLVIILAIPLYKHFHVISKHKIIFFTGCLFAIALNFGLLFFTLRFFRVDDILKTAIYTKSITGAMSMALNESLKADPNLALLLVSFSGVTGGVTGGLLIKLFKIKSSLARGMGMGASSHLVGSMTVLEEYGEEAGAVATTTLGIVGVMTAVFIPIVINLV